MTKRNLILTFTAVSDYGSRSMAHPDEALDAIATQACRGQGYDETDDARDVALDAIEMFANQVLAAMGTDSWNSAERLLLKTIDALSDRRKAPAPVALIQDEAA
jgi:hypothetical protein